MTLEFLLQDLPVFLLPIRPSVRRPLVPNGTFTTRRFAYRDEPGNRTGKYHHPACVIKTSTRRGSDVFAATWFARAGKRVCGRKGLEGGMKRGGRVRRARPHPSLPPGAERRAGGRAACEMWLFRKSLRVSAPILDARGALSRRVAARDRVSGFLYAPRGADPRGYYARIENEGIRGADLEPGRSEIVLQTEKRS